MQDIARGKESRQETASQKEKSQEEKGKDEVFKKKKIKNKRINNDVGQSVAKQSSCDVGSSLSPHHRSSPSSQQPEKQLLQNKSSFPAPGNGPASPAVTAGDTPTSPPVTAVGKDRQPEPPQSSRNIQPPARAQAVPGLMSKVLAHPTGA